MNLLSYQHISAKPFDNHQWIVNASDGRNILLNKQSADLLAILKHSTDEVDAHQKFQEHFKLVVSRQDFEDVVSKTFDQVISVQPNAALPTRKSFLTLKIPLLNAYYAGLFASPFTKLFSQRIFWPIICVAFVLNLVSIAFTPFTKFSVSPSSALLLSVLIGFSMPIHELGHIAACRKFGIKHGEVGFGFYLIFPIVYADITQIWNASKQQRIIANLGGIYLEMIYSLILFILYFSLGNNLFLWSAVGVFIKTATELNPFIRYDGYWLLSDITNTPNLMLKSKQAARNFLSNLMKQGISIHSMTAKNKWLTLYAVSNSLIITVYFGYVLIGYHQQIFKFPIAVYSMFIEIIQLKFLATHFPEGFFWILGLYILTIKLIFSLVRKSLLDLKI